MGRAKLNMELIKKEKTRRVTYRKRKEGLLRKIHEFTTLCGVNACAIIYGDTDTEPDEVWPKNNDEQIRCLIDLYESKGKNNSGGNKIYGLVDYFDDRNRKMDDELFKLRKKNNSEDASSKVYPSWLNDFMNGLSEMQLREFGNSLDERIEFIKNRLDFIKRMNLIESGQQLMIQQQPQLPGLIHNGVELKLTNNQAQLNSMAPPAPHYPTVYTVQQQEHQSIINNPNSMMMLLLNENVSSSDDAVQMDSSTGTSSYNLGYEPASSRVVENMVDNVCRPALTSYYYPVQTMPQSYLQMQYPLFPGVSPELVTLRENIDVRDIHHAQTMGISPWFLANH